MNKLLFIDTETGGLDENEYSLLSVAFILWSEDGVLERAEFFVKEDNYRVSEAAIAVNKLSLDYVRVHAAEKATIIEYLDGLSKKYYGGGKMTLAGQNVNFDRCFLKKMYDSAGADFSSHFGYRVLDVASVARFCYLAGLIDREISVLDDAISYFSVRVEHRHSAAADAQAALAVFEKLLSVAGGSCSVKERSELSHG